MTFSPDGGWVATTSRTVPSELPEATAQRCAAWAAFGSTKHATRTAAGEVLSIVISPEAIDPSDPESLGDLVLAGVNEALRSASAAVEAKAQGLMGDLGLGDLGIPGLGG